MGITENNFYKAIMYMIIKCFNRLMSAFLLMLLYGCGFRHGLANPSTQPIISHSVIGCKQIFLLQIFANGQVEYIGYKPKMPTVKHQTQISQSKLNALLKKIEDSDIESAENRKELISFIDMPREAIRFRRGDVDATVFFSIFTNNPSIEKLIDEIIFTTKAEQWVLEPHRYGCHPNASLGFFFNRLKTLQ